MKPKSTLTILITLILTTFSPNLFAAGTYSGGSGEPNDPYLIATAEDMNEIGTHPNDWDAHFLMITDINMACYTGTQFNTIGRLEIVNGYTIQQPFTGVFDGNDYTISNFTLNSASAGYAALFGLVSDPTAEIKNVRLIDPNVHGYCYVSNLVGLLEAGTITGCGVEGGTVSGNESGIGGLVGESYGTISNCYATGDVTGGDRLGGLTGYNRGTISNCYAVGQVLGTGDRVGGLVGRNCYGAISNCYATGSVTGDSLVGGLAGESGGEEHYLGTISNCYATGDVTGGSDVGGLVGKNYEGIITNCYATGDVTGVSDFGGLVGWNGYYANIFASFWDTQTSGQGDGIGYDDGTGTVEVYGKTTAQMYSMHTFLGWGADPAVWTIDDTNDYMHLAWENSQGEPISPILSDLLGGSGTEEEPYLIHTPNDLNSIGLFFYEWNKHFKLIADMNLSDYNETNFNIIGNIGIPFTGVFDGNDHTIGNFTWNSTTADRIGLFGYIYDPNAEIKDVRLIDPNIRGEDYVGALAGRLQNGTIIGCGIEGGTVSGDFGVGGLVGHCYSGAISNCYATASITGYSCVGGLAGKNEVGTISNCYATGDASGTYYVGGLAGGNSSTISNCYATVSVSGTDCVGGLAGLSSGTVSNCYTSGDVSGTNGVGGLVGVSSYPISNCYANGTVDGNDYVGGLAGYNSNSISNSYAAGGVSGDSNVGAFAGYDFSGSYMSNFWDSDVNPDVNGIGNISDPNVIGKTTVQMQTESTFTDYGWDFVGEKTNGPNDIWTIHENQDYPRLVWDLVNFVGSYEVDFFDYAFLARRWLDDNCGASNDCDGTDLDFSGSVDAADLKIFCNYWLSGSN